MISKNPILINNAIKKHEYREQLLSSGSYGIVYVLTFIDDSQVIMKIQNKIISKHINQEIAILKLIKKFCNKFFVCYITDGEYDKEHIYIIFDYESSFKISDDSSIIINSDIIENLYEGLFMMHKLNIVHNDIKPKNILINPDTNKIKYLDFGLSCSQTDCSPFGTKKYMNPDKKLKFDNKIKNYHILDGILADHFALNVTIMELLENADVEIEFPSDIDKYNDNLKKLQILYPMCPFNENDYIIYLINNTDFKKTNVLTISGIRTIVLSVDNLFDFIDELSLTEINNIGDFKKALDDLPNVHYDKSNLSDLWETYNSLI